MADLNGNGRKLVTLYTDGGADPNPGPGGYGTVLLYGPHRKELSQGFIETTNNRMELLAVIAGLEALRRPCQVVVHSDSRYVVDAVVKRSVFRWRDRGWWRTKEERAKNVDLWQRFLVIYERHEVQMKWVKGHAGNRENERCDLLATAAIKAKAHRLVDHGYKSLGGPPEEKKRRRPS